MIETDHFKFMQRAIVLAYEAIKKKSGGPFGAVVVKEGQIIGESSNSVFRDHDPTAHAEVQAIRDACKRQQVHSLEGAVLYCSCEPCPMCFSAVHYANIDKVYYGAYHKDAHEIAGFGVDKLYKELKAALADRSPAHEQLNREEAKEVFVQWTNKMDKPEKEEL